MYDNHQAGSSSVYPEPLTHGPVKGQQQEAELTTSFEGHKICWVPIHKER